MQENKKIRIEYYNEEKAEIRGCSIAAEHALRIRNKEAKNIKVYFK